ncbi:unnamed protein product [Durusdinium trenchii]|uniref:EF-hand domain-containing protein n=1 Tax=Durusdinium trenchii TaxID=1381693 RepID=A0ABP0LC96_9DINO
MCRQIKFPADPIQVFRYLDDDGSGELTLEEMDPEGNYIWAPWNPPKTCSSLFSRTFSWATFVEWCSQNFAGGADFVQKLLPKNAKEKKLTASQFKEGIVKSGWSHGEEQLLFRAVDLNADQVIDVNDLKWLDVQAKRAQIKRTARQRALKERRKQTLNPKMVSVTMNDEFKERLKRMCGNYLRAWRLALSPNDSVTISRTQFLTACSNLGFKDAGKVLWHAFGKDELSQVSLDFLDVETAEVLAHFQRVVQQLGGVQAAWRVFDKKDVKRVKLPEFLETMKQVAPSLPAKQLFNGLDLDANGRLAVDDFKFLEKWKLPEYLTAKPSEEAKNAVKRQLMLVYKSYLKAWRVALDQDNSNRCSWPEFQAACRKVGFMGDVAGAWRALDADLSGSITLLEIDSESSSVLANFKAWADQNFGGIRSAFAVFDDDGSNSVTLREWRHACRIYGFNQGASSLFKQLDAEGMGSLSLDQVAFLDDWDFQPEKESPPATPRPDATMRSAASKGRPSVKNVSLLQELVWLWNGLTVNALVLCVSAKLCGISTEAPQAARFSPAFIGLSDSHCRKPAWHLQSAIAGTPSPAAGRGHRRVGRARAFPACRHFARLDGVRSLAASPRAAGYEMLMSPDPRDPPMVKISRFRWLRERRVAERAERHERPKTTPADAWHRWGRGPGERTATNPGEPV